MRLVAVLARAVALYNTAGLITPPLRKEVALMKKRILVLLSVVALMVVMLATSVAPAFAGEKQWICVPPTREDPNLLVNTKSLSGNQYLGEDELGAGKMNESQVVLGLLFPTHQEPPRAVQPRMCSLHYPTPGPPARRRVLASPLSLASLALLGGRDVGLVAPRL